MTALGPAAAGRERAPRRNLRWTAAAAAGLAFVTLYQLAPERRPGAQNAQTIATPVGGHRIVPLADGSTIELNTATMIRTAVSPARREVWLDRGEAYFDVLHSASVPFVVHAGEKTIAVLGTRFSVRREADLVTVAVQSGRVRVSDEKALSNAAANGTETYVGTGSIAVSRPDETLVTQSSPQNVEADLAWRRGQLVFRNDTLAEAATEFNRYNERKIMVSGKASKLTISGSFKSSNEEGFGRLLRDAYGLNVTIAKDRVQVSD